MQAVYELSTVRPHEPNDSRGYTREAWRYYCEGYYCAIGMSLRVMKLARDRFWRRVQHRRALERASQKQRDLLWKTHDRVDDEIVTTLIDHAIEQRGERRQRVQWKYEAVTLLRDVVDALERRDDRIVNGVDRPGHARGTEPITHVHHDNTVEKIKQF